MKPKLIVILGPTASGKSDLAVKIARDFNGEIVSADSRQIYTDMPIGSALIAGRFEMVGEEKEGGLVYVAGGIPHHLVSFQPPDVKLNVAEYRDLAMNKIQEVISRGKLPILVGGTGLYINAITQNFSIPKVAPDLDLRRELESIPVADLYARLEKLDPAYAAKIPSQNKRYIIRALEVITKTGQKFSDLQSRGESEFEVLKIGVDVPREVLYARINRRFDEQLKSGLIEETDKLMKKYPNNEAVLLGLGHRELVWFLKGELKFDEAVELAKQNIRRYAKRQLTWFKRDKGIKWFSDLDLIWLYFVNLL